MAKCDYCGTRILLGGVRANGLRFCNQKCYQDGVLLSWVNEVPAEVLQGQVDGVHQGNCPRCRGRGPVDVHTSYRVWSAFFLTSWSSRPQISCRGCGIKRQLGDLLICSLVGWWGVPWGLLVTPIQIGRNLYAMARPPQPAKPSPLLHRLVCLNIATYLAQQHAHGAPSNASVPFRG